MDTSNKARATIVFSKDMLGVILQSIETLISYGWLELEEKDITEGTVNESIHLRLKWKNRSTIKRGKYDYDYRTESQEIKSLKEYFDFMCYVLDIQGRERYSTVITGDSGYNGTEKYYVLESLFVSAFSVEGYYGKD